MSASAGQLRNVGRARRRGRAVAVALCVGWLAPATAGAGIVFREAETVEGAAGNSRQIRQVLAEGEACKVVLEDAGESLLPVGTYILATTVDAFLVDPAGRTIAPLDPTTMVPAASASEPAGSLAATDVVLDLLFEAPGPELLGLPTRHLVYRLRYDDDAADAGEPSRPAPREERHELWVTPWPPGEVAAEAWMKLRLAEDGGPGVERADLREALGQMYGQGFVLRQSIERGARSGAPGTERRIDQRVLREVTSLAWAPVAAAEFERPQGYAHTEFLAPPDGTADAPAAPAAPAREGT